MLANHLSQDATRNLKFGQLTPFCVAIYLFVLQRALHSHLDR
jgi:hypothetical protein